MPTASITNPLAPTTVWSRVASIAVLELLFAAGIIAFWILFFAGQMSTPADAPLRQVYLGYERAFPAADGCLSLGLCAAAFSIFRRKPIGATLTAACGGAAVFLGILDASFNLQNGMYQLDLVEGLTCAAVNAACIIVGLILVHSHSEFKSERQ
jgi:hypothetical protein